ncbi:MAG: hypothetical protein ACE5JU_20655 [Candidatus Binatia bacterium]
MSAIIAAWVAGVMLSGPPRPRVYVRPPRAPLPVTPYKRAPTPARLPAPLKDLPIGFEVTIPGPPRVQKRAVVGPYVREFKRIYVSPRVDKWGVPGGI